MQDNNSLNIRLLRFVHHLKIVISSPCSKMCAWHKTITLYIVSEFGKDKHRYTVHNHKIYTFKEPNIYRNIFVLICMFTHLLIQSAIHSYMTLEPELNYTLQETGYRTRNEEDGSKIRMYNTLGTHGEKNTTKTQQYKYIYKYKKKWEETNPEQIFWQVSSFINASVHGDETLYGGLVLYVWVVKAGV